MAMSITQWFAIMQGVISDISDAVPFGVFLAWVVFMYFFCIVCPDLHALYQADKNRGFASGEGQILMEQRHTTPP